MSLFTDLRSALTSDSAVMAITTKVYRGIPSQEVSPPFISMHVIGDAPLNDLEGEDDLQNIAVQVDCWARDLDSAHALYLAAKAAFAASAVIKVRTGYRELYEDATKLWRASSDWSTWGNG